MKTTVIVLLVVLLLATAAMSADQSSWRVSIKADNGAGMNPSAGAYIGVYPTSLEGLDAEDGSPYAGFFVDLPGVAMHVAALVPGAGLYSRSIKSPTLPVPEKTWDLYVAANVNSTSNMIRLLAFTTIGLQTPTFDGLPVRYYMRLADNKGKPGAPANGTTWELPIATTSSATPFWTSPVNLPIIRLSAATNAALLAEGYKLQFVQKAVPEPSGLLALGGCLVGLAGFIRRRR